jgi:hypothetical protein
MSDRQVTVSVYGQSYVIDLYHRSKTVLVAVGEYMGKRIEVKRSSPSAAAKAWVAAARYHGN